MATTPTAVAISTSPRSTWIWAPDQDGATAIRALLTDADCYWTVASRYGAELPTVTDVEIGSNAGDACSLLANAGYSYRWHSDQHPANRRAQQFGIPVSDVEG